MISWLANTNNPHLCSGPTELVLKVHMTMPNFFFFLRFNYFYLACVSVLPACICVPQIQPIEGVRFSETVVTDDYELSCSCWEPNVGPLQEQPVLWTLNALTSIFFFFFLISIDTGIYTQVLIIAYEVLLPISRTNPDCIFLSLPAAFCSDIHTHTLLLP